MLFKSLLLTGAIQGFFLILLLKSKGKKSNSDKLLMVWLSIAAFQLLFYYDSLSVSPLVPHFIQSLGFSLPLLSSPVLYLYIYSLSFGSTFKWKSIYIHLIAYVLFAAVLLYLAGSGLLAITYALPDFSDEVPHWLIYFLTTLLAIVPGYYTLLSLRVLLRYQKLLPDNYSYTEKINLNWLKWIVLSLLLLFVVLFLLIKFGVNYGLLDRDDLFAVVGSILSFYIFYIGYFGLRQTTVFTNIKAVTALVEKKDSKGNYKKSGLSDAVVDQLFAKLQLHMVERQPFLDEDLSLDTLAGQLDVTANQLSQVINQKSDSNFFNYVNGYRVAAVKQKLRDPAYGHYSILAIGYDCGFRSKSSFNKIFKQMEGRTPSEYQKQ